MTSDDAMNSDIRALAGILASVFARQIIAEHSQKQLSPGRVRRPRLRNADMTLEDVDNEDLNTPAPP